MCPSKLPLILRKPCTSNTAKYPCTLPTPQLRPVAVGMLRSRCALSALAQQSTIHALRCAVLLLLGCCAQCCSRPSTSTVAQVAYTWCAIQLQHTVPPIHHPTTGPAQPCCPATFLQSAPAAVLHYLLAVCPL